MNTLTKSSYTNEQIIAWLRGLFTMAWADGELDDTEQNMIDSFGHEELSADFTLADLQPITPEELASVLATDHAIAENFLRTAVMIALADGIYSVCEDDLLHQFCSALNLEVKELKLLRKAFEELNEQLNNSQATTDTHQPKFDHSNLSDAPHKPHQPHLDVLLPLKSWLDKWDVHDEKIAHVVCKMIPPQCPFERDIFVFGRKVAHIPAMCKLNPLYEQLVGLRFRALCYLADECHEDVSKYC